MTQDEVRDSLRTLPSGQALKLTLAEFESSFGGISPASMYQAMVLAEDHGATVRYRCREGVFACFAQQSSADIHSDVYGAASVTMGTPHP
jgi:hypothetical protein